LFYINFYLAFEVREYDYYSALRIFSRHFSAVDFRCFRPTFKKIQEVEVRLRQKYIYEIILCGSVSFIVTKNEVRRIRMAEMSFLVTISGVE
jgi:hypothetical protein